MSTSKKMALSVIAAIVLVGGSASIAAASPALPPADCTMQVLPAGNNFPTWSATTSGGVTTLTQNGTMFTGEMLDLGETPLLTDMFGDTLERSIGAPRTWYPVSNGAGTSLVHVFGCTIN